MSRKNTWSFNIYHLDTGELLEENVCFWGSDSEEAYVNCHNWAMRKYRVKVHVEQIT